MKKEFLKITNCVAVAMLLAMIATTGCRADLGFDYVEDSTEPGEIVDPYSNGYISFENFSVSVDVESENFKDQESGSYVSSRSDDTEVVDPSDYRVIITRKSDSEQVYNKDYATTLSESKIQLSAGYYIVYVCSEEEIPAEAWGERIYTSQEKSLAVGDENTTTIGAVECRLATIKSQVSLSADMLSLFDLSSSADVPFAVTLTYGSAELVYGVDKLYSSSLSEAEADERSGYFAPQDGESTIDVTLTGMYNTAAADENANYVSITWQETISGVEAGQSRLISIKIDNSDSGNTLITFEVQGWTYDEALGVNILSSSFLTNKLEAEIPDPDDESKATLSFDNGSVISTIYEITEDTFDDATSTYYPLYKISATPESGYSIEDIKISVSSSDSTTLNEAIVDAGYNDGEIYLFRSGVAESSLNDYLSVSENASTGVISIALKYAAIRALYDHNGAHTFTMTLTDDKGRSVSHKLYFNVVSSEVPSIMWDGGDFDQVYNITETGGLDVLLCFSSKVGIKSLKIAIDSPLLTPEFLEAAGLSAEMDLASPDDDDVDMLLDLGLPIKDDVLDKTYLEVDISEFIPLLLMLSPETFGLSEAQTDFKITISDDNGTSTETLSLIMYATTN